MWTAPWPRPTFAACVWASSLVCSSLCVTLHSRVVCVWCGAGMVIQGVFLFVFGPYLASLISPNLMEQASIW